MSHLCSFVIPAYNEEGNVKAIYQVIHEVFDPKGIPVELVMVNDGSKDKTPEVLKELYEETGGKDLTVVNFSRNFGKEAAILCGLLHAKGDYVCLIDADLQQSPEVAYQMYEKLENEPDTDCVAAFQEVRHEGAILKFFKDSFYRIINRMSSITFMPGASDFRMCRRNMIDAILDLPEYHRFSKGIFSWVGFNTAFIPYEAAERNSGSSKWSFIKLFNYAIDGIVGYSTAPLRFASVLGGILTAGSLLFLLVLLILSFIPGVNTTFRETLIGIILFAAGLQLMAAGILGEYLSRVYIQVKQRPVYIEKEVLERNDDAC